MHSSLAVALSANTGVRFAPPKPEVAIQTSCGIRVCWDRLQQKDEEHSVCGGVIGQSVVGK